MCLEGISNGGIRRRFGRLGLLRQCLFPQLLAVPGVIVTDFVVLAPFFFPVFWLRFVFQCPKQAFDEHGFDKHGNNIYEVSYCCVFTGLGCCLV